MFYYGNGDSKFVICYGNKDMEEHEFEAAKTGFDSMESADNFLAEHGYTKYGYFYYGSGDLERSLAYVAVKN